jgi:hypothetical protein
METIDMKAGYKDMSELGRAVCECVELTIRHAVICKRAKLIPGLQVPGELVREIRTRYEHLDEDAKAAIVDILSDSFRPRWERWKSSHLSYHPQDARALSLLESGFSLKRDLSVYAQYGPRDYPWQMEHRW